MTDYANKITLIVGDRQTGRTTQMCNIINALAGQTIIGILAGNYEAKNILLSKLPSDFPSNVIRFNLESLSDLEGMTHLFIDESYLKDPQLYSMRDVRHFVDAVKPLIEQGLNIVMVLDLAKSFEFMMHDLPEVSTVIMTSANPEAKYVTTTRRVAIITKQDVTEEFEHSVVEGELLE